MNSYPKLPQPFFVLAPMDDVTDTVFRQIVADCATPDLFFTEFVNVDGLQSAGRERLMKRIRFSPKEKPIIAQIWGKLPENFYKTAKELVSMGFSGVDINMGCPEKTVVKNGCCSALILNRELALEIISATREGAGTLPLSVKTRLGFNDVDYTWHELLLKQNLNMLTIHGRTRKQMSKVPADWQAIGHVRELRDKLSPQTLVVGNGDITSRQQGLKLAETHRLDGVMVGRGIFQDPFVFAKTSPWAQYPKEDRIELFKKQVNIFAATWQNNERRIATINKFCKIYVSDFDGAKELREQLMSAESAAHLLEMLNGI